MIEITDSASNLWYQNDIEHHMLAYFYIYIYDSLKKSLGLQSTEIRGWDKCQRHQ